MGSWKGWVFLLGVLLAPRVWADVIEVDASRTDQVIRGFGACSAWSGSKINDNLAQLFFDPQDGIGLSILRTRIPPDSNWNSETPAMLLAKNWGVTQIWSTEWTPPAGYKTNHDPNHGGSLDPSHYKDYADYLVRYAQDVKASTKIDLYALSPANEPDFSPSYESCLWTGDQFKTFVRDYLGPAFKTAGLTTRIVIPESYKSDLALSDPTLSDPAAAAYVDIIGEHLYGGGPLPYPLAQDLKKEYWETEISDFKTFDGGMANGLKYAIQIHRCLVDSGMNAYHYWWLVPVGSSNSNEGLVDQVGGPTKRLYCLGNFSKFIRPDFYRIETTPETAEGVWASAYKDTASGRFVVVAINTASRPVSQDFQLRGLAASSVTPWVTDNLRNLEKQAGVEVADGKFSYSLPVSSVVSFTGEAAAFGPTATPTPTEDPSTAAVAVTDSCLVDDLEGGKTNRRGGHWETYSGANSTVELEVQEGGSPASPGHCLSAKGDISDYGGVSCTLDAHDSLADLSRYKGVCFWTKGNGKTYWFQVAIPTIADGDNYGKTFLAPSGWAPVTILFNQMAQRNFGAFKPFTAKLVLMLQWSNAQSGRLDFKVDDVRLLGADCP